MLAVLYRICDALRHRARRARENPAHAWGSRGEDLAHRHLRSRGYVIVARNYRTLNGSAEVDLVARDGETIVFVEVKTRASADYGTPDTAVDAEKRRRIRRGSVDYLRRSGNENAPVRFDIVNVLFDRGEKVEHIEDAFTVATPES